MNDFYINKLYNNKVFLNFIYLINLEDLIINLKYKYKQKIILKMIDYKY